MKESIRPAIFTTNPVLNDGLVLVLSSFYPRFAHRSPLGHGQGVKASGFTC